MEPKTLARSATTKSVTAVATLGYYALTRPM